MNVDTYSSVLENFLCKGKHVDGLSHFDIALYDEDQGVDFYSSGKQRSRESKQILYSVFWEKLLCLDFLDALMRTSYVIVFQF